MPAALLLRLLLLLLPTLLLLLPCLHSPSPRLLDTRLDFIPTAASTWLVPAGDMVRGRAASVFVRQATSHACAGRHPAGCAAITPQPGAHRGRSVPL